jgi:cysteine-rich repeat protein
MKLRSVLGFAVVSTTVAFAACGDPLQLNVPPGTGGGSSSSGVGGMTSSSSGDTSLSGLGDSGAPDSPDDSCTSNCSDVQMMGVCGDGHVDKGETCDDGNTTPGDGCSGVCMIEPGYTCPTPGMPCVSTLMQICGDGKIEDPKRATTATRWTATAAPQLAKSSRGGPAIRLASRA